MMGVDGQTAIEQRVQCPRCGYDQRGVIATWRDACPLQTACAECGLLIEWADLLSPRRKYPRWCIEYGRGIVDAIKRFFLSIALMFWPRKMWRSLQMSHEIRWRRFRNVLLAALTAGLVFYAIARINPVLALHLWVLPSYSGTTSVRVIDSMATSVFSPWSTQSPGTMSMGFPAARATMAGPLGPAPATNMFTFAYPSPSQLQQVVADYTAGRPWYSRRYRYDDAWRAAGSAFVYATVLTASLPLVFAVLPVSRKQAKVRWAHVWRVAIYNALWLVCLLFLVGAAILLMPWNVEVASMIMSQAPWVLIFWPLASVLFWQAAIRHYLKMSRSWAVALSVGVIAWLASGAAVLYINIPMSLDEMWVWTKRLFT